MVRFSVTSTCARRRRAPWQVAASSRRTSRSARSTARRSRRLRLRRGLSARRRGAHAACTAHPAHPGRQNAQPSHVIVSSVVSVNRYILAHAAQNRRICGVHAGLVAGDQLRQAPGRECRSRERRTGYYRTPRLCSRCSTAARIWSVSHAVQSSVSGSPGTPVFRPEATNLTARCCEPYLSHRARNRIVKATDGSSFTVRTS